MQKRNSFFILITLFLLLSSCTKDNSIDFDRTIVIIKADDLGNMTSNWQQFISKSYENNIPISIGIISSHMTNHSSILLARELSTTYLKSGIKAIEFFNHGFDHSENNYIPEFKNPSLEKQVNHIKKAQTFLKDSIGIECKTFSAPYNQSSSVTFEALKNNPELKIWICYQNTEKQHHSSWSNPYHTKKMNTQQQLLLDIKVEALYHVPVENIKRYLKKNKNSRYLVVQIHPNNWETRDYEDYTEIIDYLKSKNCVFMTPQQYYNFLKND